MSSPGMAIIIRVTLPLPRAERVALHLDTVVCFTRVLDKLHVCKMTF